MRIFQMQRISAVALLVFMTIHMTFLHYDVLAATWLPYEISHSTVMERLASPLWKGIDIAFLFFVLMHALTGAYMVLTDAEKVYKQRKVLAWGAVVLGAAAFVYGTLTILAFQVV
jgi:succinate dehydrogenase hydrophobic anchor subunit